MVERLDAMFAAGDMPRRDRRVRRRVDLARRLAVPQLDRDRPLPGLSVRRGRPVHRRALPDRCRARSSRDQPASRRAGTARWSCRCCDRTCSERSPRTPATRCSSAATCRASRASRGRLRDNFEGSLRGLPRALAGADHFDFGRFGKPFEMYGYASRLLAGPRSSRARRCCRSSSPPAGSSTTCGSGGWSSIRCGWHPATLMRCGACAGSISTPAAATSTSSTSGAQAFAEELGRLGVDHTLELFDGRHGGITYRYPGAIRELVRALSADEHALSWTSPSPGQARWRAGPRGCRHPESSSSCSCAGSRRSILS